MCASHLLARPNTDHDDWFWMYAVAKLGRNAYMLSNDNMANHNFQNLGHNFGARWRHAHQVHF